MNKNIEITDIRIGNENFWRYFFCVNYPNAYDEYNDIDLGDIIDEVAPPDLEWSNDFTQYYDGVMDDSDGYLDNPTTLETRLTENDVLKIEFHPGDTLFFINGSEIGCTGPHWKLKSIPYKELENILKQDNGELLFLLLLPISFILPEDIEMAQKKIESLITTIYPPKQCNNIAKCIVCGLVSE